MKLVIDQKKWLNGTDDPLEHSMLLNRGGKMCCLGFYLRACKVKTDDLFNVALPSSPLPKKASWLLINSNLISSDCHLLTQANDRSEISFNERKTKIKELFAKHDVHVTFK